MIDPKKTPAGWERVEGREAIKKGPDVYYYCGDPDCPACYVEPEFEALGQIEEGYFRKVEE